MKRTIRYYRLIWFKHDLPAGLSVFLVALPLCLGIALASGAPLYAGLMSGIIGGIVVGIISGSQLGVSGPAAGLSTVVAASIISIGNYNVFILSIMVAGLFQLVLGLLRLGIFASYFPSAVIKGMLAAIGIILVSKQIPLMLGYSEPHFWTEGFLDLFSSKNVLGNLSEFNKHITRGAIVIAVISFSVILGMQHPVAKKLKMIPAPLMGVLAGVLLNFVFIQFFPAMALQSNQLVNVPSDIFSSIVFPDFSKAFSVSQVWKDGLVIGLLATLETLLCVEAVDKLDRRNRITPVNRELIAQGVGNMACGMVGALPMTAVVVRGAANADAGAKSKLSAITHGVFMLMAVLFIPFLLNKIPYASLAAILFVTGYNLTKPKLFRNMWSLGRKQFVPFILTISIILATDLLIGVCIGLLMSVYYIILNNFRADYNVTKEMKHETAVFLIKLNSNVTFLNKVKLRRALDKIPEYSILTIDGTESYFIDYDILEVISEFDSKAHERHIEVHLMGIEKVNVTAVH
ncbi:MAG: SulP family inorganic anion transporter [Sphingobacteriia bacterium]|nr:SulP family inorganic anion transporter [Sphingobacteriia bacterium]